MILVSISSTEEKYVIRLKHKIEFETEQNFANSKPFGKRTFYVFAQLFLSISKLIYLEMFKGTRT